MVLNLCEEGKSTFLLLEVLFPYVRLRDCGCDGMNLQLSSRYAAPPSGQAPCWALGAQR